MTEFLDWLARGTGVLAVLTALFGFMFREKWKQILQRSLSEDVERLKAELARSNAEHAATLVPQLEQIKHDFQQKLEAYKVSLIAQAEAAKAQSELRKSIALRYSETKFERLVLLESHLATIGTEVLALGSLNIDFKVIEHQKESLAKIRALSSAAKKAEMFLSLEDRMELISFSSALIEFTTSFVGHGKPSPPNTTIDPILSQTAETHYKLKSQIKALGSLSDS